MDRNLLKVKTHLYEADAYEKVYQQIVWLLKRQLDSMIRPVVVLCIGSDRYTGDALGPLTGSYLEERNAFRVFGTMNYPVHAGNLVEVINRIENEYGNPVIIAVDACLGKQAEVGNIEVWEGSIRAGSAVGNQLPPVGHISVIGVVNSGSASGYINLQTTPLSMVINISKIISRALQAALQQYPQEAIQAHTAKSS
ncbi:hypothetical protein P22_2304 [Propionispora sp. 2/2-37]|uniref:spore protease YyaC n=1 Tax=Propionispora sp. 2/2-37 TaxID=1677858 RepID=UPI0006BB7446|nr:spore protease YyaC [Propionispora sp. 2/2-37]CUH96215.1 hypothetical protein P22_2304 [Propionispora sp. 2/2-37]